MADPLGVSPLPLIACGRDGVICAGAGFGGGTDSSTEGLDTVDFRLTLTSIPREKLFFAPYDVPLFDDVLPVRLVVEPRRAMIYEALRSIGI
jgi:hypothetical protein